MIHGHTRITMRNPISGNIIKDVEGENTFQGSVIAQGNRSLGSARAGFYNQSDINEELWKRVVGGILLFQSGITIPSGSTVAYMSAGNKMIANAAYGYTNSGDPTELGSWNESEKIVTPTSVKQVYDWGTAQGNGTISCVCLTSKVGGYIGYGNPSGRHLSYDTQSPISLNTYQQPKKVADINNGSQYAVKALCGNFQYRFTWDNPTTTLTIYKQRVPITQASVFDWIESYVTKDISGASWHKTEVLGSGVTASTSEGKIYIYRTNLGQSIVSGGKMYVWEYNPSNNTLTEIEVTNTANQTINAGCLSVSHGKLFVNGSNVIHIFNLSNSSYIGVKDALHNHQYDRHVYFSDLPNNLSISTEEYTSNLCGIYDHTNDTYFPANARPVGINYYDSSTDALCFYGDNWMYATDNPLYLATINNITPVTKTSSLTMKVEYTLSEA